MKKQPASAESLPLEYARLCAALAQPGYLSQGSVLDRSTLARPRSGYQWTRKVARKTLTVALSREQFEALGQAIENRRRLQRTIAQMERLSRQILFRSAPDIRRRKSLSKKVLGLI